MKQKTIRTAKATVLAVEIPDGAINPVISMGYITARVPNHSYGIPTHDIWDYKKNEEYMAKYDPSKEYDDWAKNLHVEGNWQLIGRIPDITEKQADKLVESNICFPTEFVKDMITVYKDHQNKDTKFLLAIPALHSLLQSNEVYFENPLGEYPSNVCMGDALSWEQAQSKVFDKERTYLFIKVD